MAKTESHTAIETTLCELMAAISDRLDQAMICANAARKLASRSNTDAALKALMDVEPPTHDALDLFRAAMTLRNHLLFSEKTSR